MDDAEGSGAVEGAAGAVALELGAGYDAGELDLGFAEGPVLGQGWNGGRGVVGDTGSGWVPEGDLGSVRGPYTASEGAGVGLPLDFPGAGSVVDFHDGGSEAEGVGESVGVFEYGGLVFMEGLVARDGAETACGSGTAL